jgi:hypothetical protein
MKEKTSKAHRVYLINGIAVVAASLQSAMMPTTHVRCCYNCKRWHKSTHYPCQHNGPWGGDIKGDDRCQFTRKIEATG